MTITSVPIVSPTPLLKRLRLALPILFAIGLMAWLFNTIPGISGRDLVAFIRTMPLFLWIYVGASIVLNMGLIALRLKITSQFMGSSLKLSVAFRSVAISALFSLIAPVIGGLLGQQWTLRSIAPSVAVFSYVYEKALSIIVGGVLTLISTTLIWPHLLQEWMALSWPAWTNIAALILMSVIWWIFLSQEVKNEIFSYLNLSSLKTFSLLVSLNFASWALISSTFVLGLSYLVPQASLARRAGSALLVSFLSSIPISVSGWSVREFFATRIFTQLGVSEENSLWLSMGIGLVSLLAVLNIGLIMWRWHRYDQSPTCHTHPLKINHEKVIGFLAYSSLVFMFFQFTIKTGPVAVNICFGDIMALCGLALCLKPIISKELKSSFISVRWFLLGSCLIFGYAFLLGWMRLGWTAWAMNKFLGWYVILGYLCLGISFAHYYGYEGICKLLKIAIYTLAVVILFEVSKQILCLYALDLANLTPFFAGFSRNKNAFAFQILIVLGLTHILIHIASWRGKLMISFIYFALIYTWSRFSLLMLGPLILMGLATRILTVRMVVNLALLTFGWSTLYWIILGPLSLFSGTSMYYLISVTHRLLIENYSHEGSNLERIRSLFEGIELWQAFPIWGAGLGAFVQKNFTLHNHFLVIHNSLVWLLAEFGFVGASIMVTYFTQIFIRSIQNRYTTQSKMILILLIIFSVSCLVHDMTYQKIFWFFLGMSLAYIPTERQTIKERSIATL